MRAARHATAALVLSLFFPLTNWAASYRVLHTFTGGSDGGAPASSLCLDGSGNLYGTAYSGGKSDIVPIKVAAACCLSCRHRSTVVGRRACYSTSSRPPGERPLASCFSGTPGMCSGPRSLSSRAARGYVRANARRRLEFQPDLRLRRSLPGLRPNGGPDTGA